MAFYINEVLYFDFYLNGIQLPLTINNITSLAIVANTTDYLPAVRLDFLDDKGVLQSGSLTDGAILSIMVGRNLDEAQQNIMEFQLVGTPEDKKDTRKAQYLVYGILHKPKLWKCVSPVCYTGTSDFVLKQIANENGLSYSGSVTNDSMTWINGNKSYCAFIDDIVKYGYSNQTSCMSSVITPNNRLKYRNINDLEPSFNLTNLPIKNKDEVLPTYIYSNISFKNNAAINNYSFGYQNNLTQYSIDGEINTLSNIEVIKQNSSTLNVNRNIYAESGMIGNDFIPFDIGNTHQFWNQAYYQNNRYKSLFSVESTVYLPTRTDIEVLDKVKLNYINQNVKEINQSQASYWIVAAKTMAISAQQYVEKLILVSDGSNINLFNSTF